MKPLGHKSYGSIPHLPGSKRGPADRGIGDGQARILTEQCRPGDRIIVQEKVDGSNVSIAKKDGCIIPLSRAGYRAESSPYEQHHLFASWVLSQWAKWNDLLDEGERLCGEWIAQAHGTRYDLTAGTDTEHFPPFWAFDLMRGQERALLDECADRFVAPGEVCWVPIITVSDEAIPLSEALDRLGRKGLTCCAQDEVEGVVYRVERKNKVDFLAKYVRPDYVPGRYIPNLSGIEGEAVWNWHPRRP